MVATDINNDGRMDLFVANDTVQNFLYVNRGRAEWNMEVGRDRAYRQRSLQRERASRDPGMGVDAADLNVTVIRICSSPTSIRRCSRFIRTTKTRRFAIPPIRKA